MKKVNFDSFKRIHASDELIEKALAIPERTENQPVSLPWYRNVRVVAGAASVVLVATLGISLYFFFRNKAPIPVVPEVSQTASEIATNPPTDAHSEPVTDGVTETASDPKTTATDAYRASEQATQPSATPSPTGNPAPVRPDGTQAASSAPPAPTQGEPVHPAPTQQATDQPASPTTSPTMKPTDKPTDPPSQIEPEPSGVAPQSPTAEPMEPEPLIFSAIVGSSDRRYSLFHGTAYCRIYDRTAQTVLGDPDPLADSHIADTYINGYRMLYLTYNPSQHGIDVPPGSYAIAFYNENGENIYTYYINVD